MTCSPERSKVSATCQPHRLVKADRIVPRRHPDRVVAVLASPAAQIIEQELPTQPTLETAFSPGDSFLRLKRRESGAMRRYLYV
jgi:hypothetical protein